MKDDRIEIRFITAEETWPLRLKVLRNNSTATSCPFSGDDDEGAFHLGAFVEGRCISIASFLPDQHKGLPGKAHFRLRGMATDPSMQGKGAGGRLITFSIEELRSRGAGLLWCNARIGAVSFYERMGFRKVGDAFAIEGIGLHYMMWQPL